MNTAYRVWDGGRMHYWDDEGIRLVFEHDGSWFLWLNGMIAHSGDGKSVLMWGTGLEDKNEKMIYDKDSILDHDTDTRFVVKYDNKQAGFYLDIGIGNGSGAFMVGDLEVIGDTYQNPELLEGAE
ncbi:YopX family protein [Bacillus atrophaeus]|uniref:YopX family protein n=1 Tax=Bacillus atrophaeus TaxID=1452 RepID=UPI003CF7842B